MSIEPSISGRTVRRLHSLSDAHVRELAELLIDCVDGGASVSFMHPLSPAKASEFWSRVAAEVSQGRRALLVAEDALGIAGTVQLILDQPENQPHRADLSKNVLRGFGAFSTSTRHMRQLAATVSLA